jgi:Domain of unknown function (DUF4279)
VAEDLRQYIYLKVAGSESERFDPGEVTRRTGIQPTESWRVGDPAGNSGRTRRFDFWKVESPSGRAVDLTSQATALFARLADEWASVSETVRPLGPVLQYVVHTANEPVMFEMDNSLVGSLLELGAEVDCDLYWVCRPGIANGACINCTIPVPANVEEARFYIGGEQRAAEVQCRFAVYGLSYDEARRLFELDPTDKSTRLDDGLDVCYLDALDCLQFTSDFVPASGYIEELEPEKSALRFLGLVTPMLARVPSGTRREFFVSLTERGDYQGTAGLHFDLTFLERISQLRAALGVRLRYVPEPSVRATGECAHCEVKVT